MPVIDALLPDEIVRSVGRENLADPVRALPDREFVGLFGDAITPPPRDVGIERVGSVEPDVRLRREPPPTRPRPTGATVERPGEDGELELCSAVFSGRCTPIDELASDELERFCSSFGRTSRSSSVAVPGARAVARQVYSAVRGRDRQEGDHHAHIQIVRLSDGQGWSLLQPNSCGIPT